jgi:hypothetical protein
MRYVLLGLVIVAVGLSAFGLYDYYINLPRAEFKVAGVLGEYMEGNSLKYTWSVVNLSRTEKCFIAGSKIKFRGKTVVFPQSYFMLESGETLSKSYDYAIPESLAPGNSSVEVELRNKTADTEKTLARKIIPFLLKQKPPVERKVVPPAPLGGTIKLQDLPAEAGFGGKIAVKALAANTSDRAGRFSVKLSVGPLNAGENGGYIPEKYDKTITLDENAQKIVRVEYKLDSDKPEGAYSVKAQLFDAETSALLSSDEGTVQVADKPPRLEVGGMKLFLKRGEAAEYSVRALDDRGIASVTCFSRDLRMNAATSYMMTLSSGSATDGIWSCFMGLAKKNGDFRFHIEALDSKSQEARTEEYTVTVVK